MIQSFADKDTEDIFHGVYSHSIRKNFTSHLVKLAQRKMDLLNCAISLEALRMIPANKVELVRDVGGKYSIPIYEDWRILFRWNLAPEEVEIRK